MPMQQTAQGKKAKCVFSHDWRGRQQLKKCKAQRKNSRQTWSTRQPLFLFPASLVLRPPHGFRFRTLIVCSLAYVVEFELTKRLARDSRTNAAVVLGLGDKGPATCHHFADCRTPVVLADCSFPLSPMGMPFIGHWRDWQPALCHFCRHHHEFHLAAGRNSLCHVPPARRQRLACRRIRAIRFRPVWFWGSSRCLVPLPPLFHPPSSVS